MLTAITAGAITFSLWGLYFTDEGHLEDDALHRALLWGYGHFAIFAAGAATGAGFAVFHEVATGHADIGYRIASYAIAIPVAIYLLTLWLVRDQFCMVGWRRWILPSAALLIGVVPAMIEEALLEIAILAVLTVALRRAPGSEVRAG